MEIHFFLNLLCLLSGPCTSCAGKELYLPQSTYTYILLYYDVLDGIVIYHLYTHRQAHYIDFNFMQIKLSNFEGVTTLQYIRIYDANQCVHVYIVCKFVGI